MSDDNLQFDRAETIGPGSRSGGEGIVCVACKSPIADQYFSARGQTVCRSCRDQISSQLASTTGNFPRGILFGIGAAVLGAILYFGVAAITGYEIGLVAIAVGWLVGRAIQKGSGGHGGRRYQIVAVAFTYLSVAAAYFGLAVKQMSDDGGSRAPVEASDSTRAAPQPATGEATAASDPHGGRPRGAGTALLILLGISIGLPIMSALGSFPGGLISLAILFFGIYQAWRMTTKVEITFEGPFNVGRPAAPGPSSPSPGPG